LSVGFVDLLATYRRAGRSFRASADIELNDRTLSILAAAVAPALPSMSAERLEASSCRHSFHYREV
jgi:hypothetical protein